MRAIEIFVQGQGVPDIVVLSVQPQDTVATALSKMEHAVSKDANILVFLEDVWGAIETEAVIEELLPLATEDDDCGLLRFHVNHHRHVEVDVRFNGQVAKRRFSPSATIERVHRWAARRAFGLSARDAAEHVLQIRGTTVRPERDTHLGVLTTRENHVVCFDLVPFKRVEG